MKSEWKGEELSANSMCKYLNKVFKAVVNEPNNALPTFNNQDHKCPTSFQNPGI